MSYNEPMRVGDLDGIPYEYQRNPGAIDDLFPDAPRHDETEKEFAARIKAEDKASTAAKKKAAAQAETKAQPEAKSDVPFGGRKNKLRRNKSKKKRKHKTKKYKKKKSKSRKSRTLKGKSRKHKRKN